MNWKELKNKMESLGVADVDTVIITQQDPYGSKDIMTVEPVGWYKSQTRSGLDIRCWCITTPPPREYISPCEDTGR